MKLPESLTREDRICLLGALSAISYNKGAQLPESLGIVFKKMYSADEKAEPAEIDTALLDLAGAITLVDPAFVLSELIEDFVDGKDFRHHV